jgi:tocopherol cyclase
LIFRSLRKIWMPASYQGKSGMKGYFEGWYYKLVDSSENRIAALIPGVSFDKEGKHPHSFIQFIDGTGVLSHYFSYAIEDFSFSAQNSSIKIGKSFFSPARIDVNLDSPPFRIRGALDFKGLTPWPVKPFSPGAMGWYAFVPRMECYHGVLSFDHSIQGGLELNGKLVDFSAGRGYIEKDWGRSFPKYHIWVQTNHFEKPGTSLMVSIASVPWLGSSFDGFIAGLQHDGRLYPFTTYNGSRIVLFQYDQGKLGVQFRSKQYRLELEVSYLKGAELKTPVLGEMRGRLSESLSAVTRLKLFQISNESERIVFEGAGRHTGLEIEGEIPAGLIK